MNEKLNACSGLSLKLVFACSGAADVGCLADRAARQLMQDGAARMYCLAGVGGRVPEMLERVRAACQILVIDGCKQECGRRTLEQAGFTRFEHLKLGWMGFQKGSSPMTGEFVRSIADKGAELLA